MKDNNKCAMCQNLETQLHIFSNSKNYSDRYTWRNDSVLKTISNKLSRTGIDDVTIYVDCEHLQFPCTSELFSNSRPDAVVKWGNKIFVIELTVCFDTNTKKSRDYKMNRYRNLKDELLIECELFDVIYLEFTTLGFISKDSFNQYSY